MRFPTILLPFISLLPCLSTAKSTSGSRLLVIDEGDQQAFFKAYIWDLRDRGFNLTFLSPKSNTLSLITHDVRNYDHVLLLPPQSKAYGPKITSKHLLDFINASGNILALLAPHAVPEQLRELARELDVHLAPRGEIVVDHFNWLPKAEGNEQSHEVILVPKPTTVPGQKNFFGGHGGQEEYVAFRGTGHSLGNSPLLNPILPAPRTAYSYDPSEETLRSERPWAVGTQMFLATGVQARNNARMTFVGSAESFGDDFLGLDGLKVGPEGHKVIISNRGFARDVTAWTFQELGVLKVVEAEHHAVENGASDPASSAETGSQTIYKVKTPVTYSLSLTEHTLDNGWVPYIPPPSDEIQLELVKLDPYYRVPLTLAPPPSGNTVANYSTFTATFPLPDQHGVFAFRTSYKRPYLSNVEHKIQVTVRHVAHDEYQRSYEISGAWVWIAGIAVVVGGWGAFVGLWLFSEAGGKGGVRKATGKTQ